MSLPEALWIVCQNKHGVKMNYWDVYLPAILIVNEAFPVTGFYTIETDEGEIETDICQWRQEQNERYDRDHNG